MRKGSSTSVTQNAGNRPLTVLGERRTGVLQFTRNRCWSRDCQALGGTIQNIMPKPDRIGVIVILCNIILESA